MSGGLAPHLAVTSIWGTSQSTSLGDGGTASAAVPPVPPSPLLMVTAQLGAAPLIPPTVPFSLLTQGSFSDCLLALYITGFQGTSSFVVN